MIIIRQNEYSSKGMQLVKGLKKLGNRAMVAVDNAGLRAGEALGIAPKTPVKFRFKPKTNAQLNRETVRTVRGAQERAIQAINTPLGEAADKGIKFAAGNPIAATGNAASVALPLVNPALAAVPTGVPSIAAESALKKAAPRYAKVTKKMEEGYANSRMSKNLRQKKGPTLLNLVQNAPNMIML